MGTPQLSVVAGTPVFEALERLRRADGAIDTLTDLLSGYDNSQPLDGLGMACLLDPIRMEVHAALDELEHIPH